MFRMLPDSNIDISVISNSISSDTTKIVQALTRSMKYEEILSSVVSSSLSTIDFKHTYSGIPIHIDITTKCDTNISNFIRYAKRVKGYKSLYLIFRHFLSQFNIACSANQKMIIHMLIIYYLQVSLEYVINLSCH